MGGDGDNGHGQNTTMVGSDKACAEIQSPPGEGQHTTVQVLTEEGPPIYLTSEFDGGSAMFNCNCTPQDIKVLLKPDPFSAFDNAVFFQGWAFRVTGAKGRPLTFHVVNIHQANAGGDDQDFKGYKARYSYDRKHWLVIDDTTFEKGRPLTFHLTPEQDVVYLAYAPIYGYQDHLDFLAGLARLKTSTPFSITTIGLSPQKRPVDLLTIGTPGPNKVRFWTTGRVHPGETYTSWWMEGLILRLLDDTDTDAQQLLQQAVVYLVPNINPDSTALGFYRTSSSGMNFNRVWDQASPTCAPELYCTQQAMRAAGVDLCLDVHTDENEGDNFIFWPGYGMPEGMWSEQVDAITRAFTANYKEAAGPALTADCAYPQDPPGTTPLIYGDSWTTGTFKAAGGTIEMTMKDLKADPQPATGWSPERASAFGQQVVRPMLLAVPALRAYRGYS